MSAAIEKVGSHAISTVQPSRILVVYYTRTGKTREVAEHIVKCLGCDVEEIIDTKVRGGPIGFIAAAKDAGREILTTIERPKLDPSSYDLVLIGSPVWNNTVSTPIRTYLSMHKDKIPNVAFFLTQGRKESEAFYDMQKILNKPPIATLYFIRIKDVDEPINRNKIDGFLNEIGSRMSKDSQ